MSSLGAWRGTAGLGIYEASKWTVSDLTESLRAELADFDSKYAASNLDLSGRTFSLIAFARLMKAESTIMMELPRGKVAAFVEQRDGKQPGDMRKGAKAFVDVLSDQSGEELPLRLPVGNDAYETIKKKCETTLELLEQWKSIITVTDVDNVKPKA